jgi:hypothetical protein
MFGLMNAANLSKQSKLLKLMKKNFRRFHSQQAGLIQIDQTNQMMMLLRIKKKKMIPNNE